MHELAISNTRAELPALIARAGDRASWRFVEFFTVNIRNRNTRAAYCSIIRHADRATATSSAANCAQSAALRATGAVSGGLMP
jgi:hypothetical protein